MGLVSEPFSVKSNDVGHFYYRPQTTLREGNVFIPVSHSVQGGGQGMHGEGGMHGGRRAWQGGVPGKGGGACVAKGACMVACMCAGETATEAAVCILVECILVRLVFLFHQWQGLHLGLRLISNKYIQTFSVNL